MTGFFDTLRETHEIFQNMCTDYVTSVYANFDNDGVVMQTDFYPYENNLDIFLLAQT